MKNFKFYLLLILTFPNIVFSQNDWNWKSPSPQGNEIRKIYIGKANSIYGIGNFSTVISSTNSGTGWNVSNRLLDLTDDLISYNRISGQVFYIGTSKGKIIKTSNAGSTWNLHSTLPENSSIIALSFFNNIGYAVTNSNKIYKTINNGIIWDEFKSFSDNVTSVEIVNENTGYITTGFPIYGDCKIFKFIDGGILWVENNLGAGMAEIVKFIDESTGFIKRGNSLLKTTDSGLSWSQVADVGFEGTAFIFNVDSMIVIPNINEIRFTTNGGVNWYQRNIPQGNYTIINFENFNKGYLFGWNNKIIRTDDNGISWHQITEVTGSGTANGWLKKLDFVNENTGYTVGWNGVLKKTTDKGESWQNISTPITSHITSLQFLDENTGYIIGGNSGESYIAKTTNGGNSFNIIFTFNSYVASGIKFITENTGFAIGYYQFYMTTNAGINWVYKVLPDSIQIYGIDFFNANTGVICGTVRASTVRKAYRTSDAGESWNEVHSTNENLFKIKFTNNQTGFMIGNGIRKTSDGGLNWIKLNVLLHNPFLSGIYFLNEQTGYVSGFGDIYRTTNGGVSWFTNISLPTNHRFEDIKFFDINTGIIAGMNNSILKTYNGGGSYVVNVQNNQTNIPGQFVLSQNYPNPFNPVTNIKFSLPTTQYTILKIFDITGREIVTLVNEVLQAGSYEFMFDASELSSGVYFYQLMTDDFVQTRKMVLTK